MTTEKKNETQQNVMIDVSKTDFKKAIKAHKKFGLTGKFSDQDTLGCINFEIDDDNLILSSTDGNKALISKIKLLDNFGSKNAFCLSANLLSKLTFPKGKMDTLRISADEINAKFIDFEFNISQLIKLKNCIYPNIEKSCTKKNDFTVKLALSQLKDLALMYSKSNLVDLCFDANNNLSAILVTSDSADFSQTAIVMPWKYKDDEKDKEK